MSTRSLALVPACPMAALLALFALFLALLVPTTGAQTATTTNALAVALDAPDLAFASSGAGAWFSQTATTRDGIDAVQSGALAASAKATLTVTVTGITRFSFKWKVSSESNRDILTFYIDDVAQPAPISGNVDWQTRTYTLSTASHTLRWEYAKDATVSSYSDAGWVDQFTVLEATIPYITSHPADVVIAPETNAALSVATLEGAGTFTYQWYQGESGVTTAPVTGATGSVLLTPPLRATTRYWMRISKGDQNVNSRSATVTITPRRTHSLLANGSSEAGALGLGETLASPTPAKVDISAVNAAAGENHSLFLRTDGSLWAMGANSSGQLGDGTDDDRTAPVRSLVDDRVVQIAAGASHSVFIKADGSLWGMGSNTAGQLGATAPAVSSTPVQIASAAAQFVTGVAQIAANETHTLFLKTDGTLWALGAHGLKASVPPVAASTPVQVASGVAFVTTGKAHTLFIKTDGVLWAWGENGSGQLGDGTTTDRDTPVAVADHVTHAAAGKDHSLFVRSDATLWATGSHASGQLGAGFSVGASSSQPIQISANVARVVAGENHSLFLKTDGSLWAMGANGAGQLGDGTTANSNTPVSIASGIVDFSAGKTHTLLLQTPPSHTITFDLGEGARRTGGGALVQSVREGESAIPPIFVPPSGKALQQWSVDFSNVTASLTVEAEYLAIQTVTFIQPPKQALVPPSGTVSLSATSSSGLPVEFIVVSGPAKVDGATLTYTAAGNVVVRAVCASAEKDGVVYASASLERTIVITPAKQTLTFSPALTATFGDAPIELTATTTAPELAVTFEVVSGPATLSGSTLTFTGAGNVVVRALQAGNDSYSSAVSAPVTIKVAKKELVVSATSLRRAVSQPNPVFVLNYSGFEGSDTATKPGVITTPPSATTGATSTSAPGIYPVVLKGGASANYTFVLGTTAPTLTVLGYGGAYEALIADDTSDTAAASKLELTVATRTLEYTGTLRIPTDPNPVTLKGTLAPSADFSSASHTFTRAAKDPLPAVQLSFTVSPSGVHGVISIGEGITDLAFDDGVILGIPPAPLGEGAHTLLLGQGPPIYPVPTVNSIGHASALIAAKTANLTLKGKLADGTALTATLKPAADRSYRVWINPYGKRTLSFLAGRLALEAHPSAELAGRYYISADSETTLVWRKAALPVSTPTAKRDAAYRAGFGPLFCPVLLDPWLPPRAAIRAKGATPAQPAITLVQRLGLAETNTESATLDVLLGDNGIDLGARTEFIPTDLTLSSAGKISVAAPITVPANQTAWKILKLNPATGAFTGRFTLRDPPISGTRDIVRTVDFSGTFRQPLETETDAPVAEGFFLLPALDASAEKTSHPLYFLGPPSATE